MKVSGFVRPDFKRQDEANRNGRRECFTAGGAADLSERPEGLCIETLNIFLNLVRRMKHFPNLSFFVCTVKDSGSKALGEKLQRISITLKRTNQISFFLTVTVSPLFFKAS